MSTILASVIQRVRASRAPVRPDVLSFLEGEYWEAPVAPGRLERCLTATAALVAVAAALLSSML
jgi:hypothetical protein